jgi:hypothetical protein
MKIIYLKISNRSLAVSEVSEWWTIWKFFTIIIELIALINIILRIRALIYYVPSKVDCY